MGSHISHLVLPLPLIVHHVPGNKKIISISPVFIAVSMTPLYSINPDLSNGQFWSLFMIRPTNHQT